MSDTEDKKPNTFKVLHFPKRESPVLINEDAPEPVPEVIDILENWLKEAKSGKLQSVALTGLNLDGGIVTEYATDDDTFDGTYVGVGLLSKNMLESCD